MVVQLLPAVSPPPSLFSSVDDVMETREMLLSMALSLRPVSVTHSQGREPRPSFVLDSHVILWSQRSFFMSMGDMDSGWAALSQPGY